jgi:hypothetical protein
MYYRNDLTQQQVLNLFDYNPNTGILTKKGTSTQVGFLDSRHYRSLTINKRMYKAHRIIWLMVFGHFPEQCIDHINRIKTDNRLVNLKEASFIDNMKNRPLQRNNTSSKKGVFFTQGMWYARIYVEHKTINLGRFSTFELAKQARITAEYKYGFTADELTL